MKALCIKSGDPLDPFGFLLIAGKTYRIEKVCYESDQVRVFPDHPRFSSHGVLFNKRRFKLDETISTIRTGAYR